MGLDAADKKSPLTPVLRGIQARLSAAGPTEVIGASALYEQLRRALARAIRAEALRNGEYALKRLLRLTPDPKGRPHCSVITGGPLDFGRNPAPGLDTHFVRADGGVVHFHMTLREDDARSVDVLAYGFEVYFPSGDPIGFVRFDLNFGGHANDEQGLRSHLHPGHEDLQLPSPVMTPLEALMLVLYGCQTRRTDARS